MTSLAKLDERISARRRAYGEMLDSREELFAAIDTITEAVDALQAKDELTEEEAKSLEAKLTELKEKNTEATKLGDTARAAEAEIQSLVSQRADREELNRQRATASQPQPRQAVQTSGDTSGSDGTSGPRVLEATADDLDHDIACFFRNSYIAKLHGRGLAQVCAGESGENFRNDRLHAAVTKTTNPSILPPGYVPRMIELLRPKTVVRRMKGLRQIPLPNGKLTMPRQSASSTANYTGEMANIALSEPGTDDVNLSAKKLTAMVVESGEMMRHSNPTSDQLIRDDIVQVVSLKEDSTFIRSAGSALIPKGLKAFADDALVAATQVITANLTVNLANVTTDIGRLLLALRNANTPYLNPYFLMSPRTERFLMDLRDGNGNIAFPEMARGQLRGVPYEVTTQIPDNLTVNTVPNCSELYLVDASEFIIADTDTFELQVSTEAAYHDGAEIQAAFSQDAAVFRLIEEHDTAMRHLTSVAYLEQVNWGAP